MSNAPASPAAASPSAASLASPAAALLTYCLGQRAAISTFSLPEGYSPSPSERVGVCVGWTARSTDMTPGLVPQPVIVRPIPEMGTYLVSYRQVSEESGLLGLPDTVSRLIDMAQSGAYWTRVGRQGGGEAPPAARG